MLTSKTKRRYATKTVIVNMVPRKCDTFDTGSPMLGKDARYVWNATLAASVEGKNSEEVANFPSRSHKTKCASLCRKGTK